MLNEISSTIKTFLELFEIINNQKIKSTFLLLVALSVVLVKPAVYYTTLYDGFCKIICFLLVLIILFSLIGIYLDKRSDFYFHTETMKLLMFFSAVLIVFIIWGLIKYELKFSEVFKDAQITRIDFVDAIHKTPYIETFYVYVFNNLLYVLLLCINFIQMVLMINFFIIFIKTLYDTEKPFKYGFPSHVLEKLLINTFLILSSSPLLYDLYATFWNNIF